MIYIPHGEYNVTYLKNLISIAPCTQLNVIKQIKVWTLKYLMVSMLLHYLKFLIDMTLCTQLDDN